MGIPLGREHSAEAHGAARHDVICEECSTHFVYIMERTGSGEGFSPLFLDESGAENRAEEKAERNLAEMMANDIDPVPCPSCGHVQAEMIAVAQSQQYCWMETSAILVAIVFAILLITAMVETSFSDTTSLVVRIAAASTGALAFGLAAGQKRLQENYDPNAVDLTERLRIGQHRAVTCAEIAEDGFTRLEEQLEDNAFTKTLSAHRESMVRRLCVCMVFLWLCFLCCRTMYDEATNGVGSFWWPKTNATIDEASVVGRTNSNGATLWSLDMKYHFDVDGVEYTGQQYRFCPEWTSSKMSVEKLAKQLSAKNGVTVSYSAGTPSVSALRPGLTPGRYLLAFLSAGVFILVLGFTLSTAIRLIRSRNKLEKIRDEVIADETNA